MSHLHIYGQAHPHDDVFIAGTDAALVRLRDAIDRALSVESSATAAAMTNDGEGYAVVVIRASDEDMAKVIGPYSSEMFQGAGCGPHKLLPTGRYRTLVEATREEKP